MSNGLDIEPPGVIIQDSCYNFDFNFFQKPYESYYGNKVSLRYIIRATLSLNRFKQSIVKEQDVGVLVNAAREDEGEPILMEVGISDFLNIKIDFPGSNKYLDDVLGGQISFTAVKLMIKKMDLNIVRKEIIGVGDNQK